MTKRAKVWEVESALGRASGPQAPVPFALAFLSYCGESRSLCSIRAVLSTGLAVVKVPSSTGLLMGVGQGPIRTVRLGDSPRASRCPTPS